MPGLLGVPKKCADNIVLIEVKIVFSVVGSSQQQGSKTADEDGAKTGGNLVSSTGEHRWCAWKSTGWTSRWRD
jgi:hypothetical protein